MTSRYGRALGGVALVALLGCGGAGSRPAAPRPSAAGRDSAGGATGAVVSVSGSGMVTSGGTGVAELLRGRVAGLEVIPQPNGGYRYLIRGMSTISGDSPQPLFIVDGVPVDAASISAALTGLTRDDIRRVDVLKDVASTSVYGMRAAGGVVIITTRRR